MSTTSKTLIGPAQFPQDTLAARNLLESYVLSLAQDLAPTVVLQDVTLEAKNVAEIWQPSSERSFLLAYDVSDQVAIGCVALRPFPFEEVAQASRLSSSGLDVTQSGLKYKERKICEMKLLFVTPSARGRGLGRLLIRAIIEEGRRLGFHEMRMYTGPELIEAIKLYESLGLERCDSSSDPTAPGLLFFRQELQNDLFKDSA